MIDWGGKKFGPQAPGIQIGPRKKRSGNFGGPNLNIGGVGRAVAGGLNAVGAFARSTTQARERIAPGPGAPASKAQAKPPQAVRKAYGAGGRANVMPNKPKPPKPPTSKLRKSKVR